MTKAPRKIIMVPGHACNQAVQMEPCHHPECHALVRSSYVMKLCPKHAHTPNLCPCQACKARDARAADAAHIAKAEADRNRPGLRRVHPRIISFGNSMSHASHISLPAEPWDAGS